jgi:CDP-diglyceride synthetase
MTKTRVIAALVLTPLAIAAILLLPTPWLMALVAVIFLVGLWEWLRLTDIDDTLARSALLVLNLALMVAIVWAADSGAYFAGRHYGRRKLSPRISPNKTVEGLAGGLACGLAVALAFAPLAGATLAQLPAVALVALVAVGFSVVGDLFESLLKRHVGAKDSGDLIPGHGGILDRIDGVVAALPVFALGKAWFGF